MNIDVQELVNAKLKEIHKNKVIEMAITETLEKVVVNSIVKALSDYDLQRSIQKQVTEEVSSIVKDIGFTAYNSFIAAKVREITEGVCQKDIADKIQDTFDKILIMKRESVKLSEICELYRKCICDEVEESEQYDLQEFWTSVEPRNGWIDFKFGKEEPVGSSRFALENSVEFTVHRYFDQPDTGTVSIVYLDGRNISDKLRFGYLSEIELLLINLYYNKTPIEIDVEIEDDIDNTFDVDI